MPHLIEHVRDRTRPKAAVTLLLEGDRRGIVCEDCFVADTPASRMRGLLGRRELPRGEGILLQPARSIHTAFMRFAIDAVFLSGEMEVVEVRSDLGPWRAVSCRGAKAVLELAAGEAERRGVEIGDRLLILEAPPMIDVDMTGLFERVGAMLAGEGGGQHGWDQVELLLTEGYALTLALESERWRIERRLAERTASRRRKKSAQTLSLAARHDDINRDIHCLRALLGDLYDHGRDVRDSERQGGRMAKPESRAA
jgi:uncharacterized membrane protein (UPF0127 family)